MKKRGPFLSSIFYLLSSVLCLLFPSGCATSFNPATGQQEALFIDIEQENRMGESISKRVEEEYPSVRDPELLERLDRIGGKIAAASGRKNVFFRFNVIEEKEPNAFALPGGIIYVTMGLIEISQSDDELASVLGHEVGHVTARHIVKRLQAAIGMQLMQILAAGTGSLDARTKSGMDLAFVSILTAFSQSDELEADRLGVRYMKEAGFQPTAAVTFLMRLRDYTMKQPLRQFSYFRTHPYFGDRLRVVRGAATGSIGFDDYINLREN